MKLIKRTPIESSDITYNLHVKEDHNYIVEGGIVASNCHLAKSKEISCILEKSINAQYRLGFTGSLDKSLTHKQMLISLFGETTKVATTKGLQDAGLLANIKIKGIVLHYNAEIRKAMRKAEYKKEMQFIISNDRRNNFIRNLALSLTGNTLILFTYVENHGEILNRLITEKDSSRPVYFVHGGVETEDRERVRNLTETGDNVIIIASSGVFSTGVNVKRIHNIIFTSPTKSMIRVIQSIGRGLRLSKDKEYMRLFDIADDLRIGKHENHTWKHFGDRLAIYAEEEFAYTISEVNLE